LQAVAFTSSSGIRHVVSAMHTGQHSGHAAVLCCLQMSVRNCFVRGSVVRYVLVSCRLLGRVLDTQCIGKQALSVSRHVLGYIGFWHLSQTYCCRENACIWRAGPQAFSKRFSWLALAKCTTAE
jgi:hypothetical protein